MTAVLIGETTPGFPSPYEEGSLVVADLGLDLSEFGIPSDFEVAVDTLRRPADSLEEARGFLEKYGAVWIGRGIEIEVPQEDGRPSIKKQLGEVVDPAIDGTVDLLDKFTGDDTIIKPKNFGAYNKTLRRMFSVAYENVTQHFPPIVQLQRQLLPMIQFINDDQDTIISTDPAEGTVLNLQLFDESGSDQDLQQHGAHSDRVDTTLVVGLDNIGPNGDFVLVRGYPEACEALGLNEHLNFYGNLATILQTNPGAIHFLRHPVQQGETLMVRSDSTHFIPPKTLGDVRTGIAHGRQPRHLGRRRLLLGRGIANMAYESGKCQALNVRAQVVEQDPRMRTAGHPKNPGFYAVAERVLSDYARREQVSRALTKQLLGVMVKRQSAVDLYGDDSPDSE